MTIAARTFLSSMCFGFAVALLYWSFAREPVGTVLLLLFGTGLMYVTAYLFMLTKKAALSGDVDLAPSDLAGEQIGVFQVESPWPIVLALGAAGLLVGIVMHPVLAVLATGLFFTILWLMVRESRED